MPIKYVLLPLLIIALFFTNTYTNRVHATTSDLEFICNGKCLLVPEKPLFDENNIKPGDYFVKTIKVYNLRNEPCSLYLSLQSVYESNQTLACNLFTNISDTSLLLGSPFTSATNQTTLKHLYLTKKVFLGNVFSSTQKVYKWAVYFNPFAQNSEIGAKTRFNFDITLECSSPPVYGEVLGVNNKSVQALPISNYCPSYNTLSATDKYITYAINDLNSSKVASPDYYSINIVQDQEVSISFLKKVVQYILFYLQLLVVITLQFFD